MLKELMGPDFDSNNPVHVLRAVQKMFGELSSDHGGLVVGKGNSIFDAISGGSNWTHPDAINELCDAVAALAGKTGDTLYTVQMWGCTEPALLGPFDTEEARIAETTKVRYADENDAQSDSYCRLTVDAAGVPSVGSFIDGELDG